MAEVHSKVAKRQIKKNKEILEKHLCGKQEVMDNIDELAIKLTLHQTEEIMSAIGIPTDERTEIMIGFWEEVKTNLK
jgi:hypothetical protein